MREETTDLIYAIKKNEQHREKLKEIVIDFYSEYSDTPRSEYTDSIVFNLVKTAFLDYLSTADKPEREMAAYFNKQALTLQLDPDISLVELEIKCMLTVFLLAQVRDSNKHLVNGFRR